VSKSKLTSFDSNLLINNQAVSLRSLPLFRSAVPVGRTFLRSTDTSQHKKIRQPKIGNLIFSAVRSSSSHVLFLRSVGLMHPQYSFISLQSFVRLTLHFISLKALSSISLHSSSIMSAALSFFSGCSFAQPSGLAPLPCFNSLQYFQKTHNSYFTIHNLLGRFALNQGTPFGCLTFFPRRFTLLSLLSTPQASFRSRSSVAVRLPQPRHCAPHSFRYNSANASF
jgi:hypothetical protein